VSPVVFESFVVHCKLRQQFWQDNGWTVQWLEDSGSSDAAKRDLLAAQKANVLLVDPIETEKWLHRLNKSSQDLRRVGFLDSIWLDKGVYWPQTIYPEALRDLMVKVGKSLDFSGCAYIAPSSAAWGRLCALAAFDLGYRKIRFICNDLALTEAIKAQIEKFCFGIEIEGLETAGVTLQPNNGSLLMNACDLKNDPDMKQTLLYLNFVRPGSLIVDIPFSSQASALEQEALSANYEVISNSQVRGVFDFLILRRLGLVDGKDRQTYLEKWQAFLKSTPAT